MSSASFPRQCLAVLFLALSPALAQADDWACTRDADGGWRCLPAGTASETTPSEAPPRTDAGPAPASKPGKAAAPPAPVSPAPRPTRPTVVRTVGLCPPAPGLVRPLPPADKTDIEILADSARTEGSRYVLTGHALLERAGERVMAERLSYDKALGVAEAEGDVVYEIPGLHVEAERARILTREQQAEIESVRYRLVETGAHGIARRAEQTDPLHQRLEDATYTTCPGPRPIWRLEAREFTLDRERQVARARHVKLRAGSVPVLYLPWISYSLDRSRKTGFLTPGIGHSDNNGIDVRAPFYWNIAPERDATITPRYLGKRGLQLLGEYRYLGRRYKGELNVEALPGDDLAGRDRYLLGYEHAGWFTDRLDGEVHYRHVSDKDYFRDLGDSLGLASQTHIDRNARLTWHGGYWTLSGYLQDFQTLDPTLPASTRPYRRLPRIVFSGLLPRRPLGIEARLTTELVHFDQDGRVTGTRLDLRPEVARTWGAAAWEVTPRLALRHTRYWLQGQAPGDPDTPSRTTPIASLDARLFLERPRDLLGLGQMQTLEPRLFWLYVPYRDQRTLPVFDTGLRDFNDLLLFADNRFSGADRQGDANQLTLALTSRILDPVSGTQRAALTVGQIHYFRDRTVTLPGQSPDRRSASNLIASVDVRLIEGLQAGAGIQWDPFESKTDRGSLRLRYQADRHRFVNLAYRYRSDILEQVDLSGLWYLTPAWHLVGRWNHSLRHGTLLEGLAGIEYESCCWLTRLVARSYVDSIDGNRNDTVLLQLELKGLTRIGDPVERVLQQSILGYAGSH